MLALAGLKLADRNGKFNYTHLQIEVCAASVGVFRLVRQTESQSSNYNDYPCVVVFICDCPC